MENGSNAPVLPSAHSHVPSGQPFNGPLERYLSFDVDSSSFQSHDPYSVFKNPVA